ncbi:O-antigen ligase family protein [Candidatus Parcubacteria bacterium]|nr:MAG: O-antigen ligase family protein [Candidatus Parcubacteria bacterium]
MSSPVANKLSVGERTPVSAKKEKRFALTARDSWIWLLPMMIVVGYQLFEKLLTNSMGEEALYIQEVGVVQRQVVFTTAYVLAFIGLLLNRERVLALLKHQKLMLAFLFFAFLSVFWSDLPFVSFKRWVHFAGMFLTGVCAVSMASHEKRIGEALRWMFLLPLVASLIMAVVAPSVAISVSGAWDGIYGHKNTLGQVVFMALALWLPHSFSGKRGFRKWFVALVLVLILFLAYKSESRTSQLVIAVIVGFWILMVVPLPWPSKLVLAPLPLLLLVFWFANFHVNSLTDYLFGLLGRDSSLTGRTFVWQVMWENIRSHPVLGVGYNGFWVENNLAAVALVSDSGWRPLQAHNGYLDILNELGIMGLGLFLAILLQTLFRAFRLASQERVVGMAYVLVLVSLVFHNFGETSFCRATKPGWFLFIITYVVLSVRTFGNSPARLERAASG